MLILLILKLSISHLYFISQHCAHVKTYLILRYAIKYANIDLLRYALHHTTVMFQTEIAETLKYEQTLLYIFHLTDSTIAMT